MSMMTARVITTILRLRRLMHPYIVVMTLAVIMLSTVIMLRKKMNPTPVFFGAKKQLANRI